LSDPDARDCSIEFGQQQRERKAMLGGGINRRVEDADGAADAVHVQVDEYAERRGPAPQDFRDRHVAQVRLLHR
jgi:hypothetical protein